MDMKRWTFEPSLNIFDFFCILTVSQLMSSYSLWCILIYCVTIPISATMQVSLDKSA
jgi:hypothetical protein